MQTMISKGSPFFSDKSNLHYCNNNVSESDILGPIDYLSDLKNLVSFERAMFEDYSFKYRTKIFQIFMSISPR